MEHEDGFRTTSRVLRLELSSLKIYTHVTLSARCRSCCFKATLRSEEVLLGARVLPAGRV